MSDPTVQDSKVQKASADEMKVALVEVTTQLKIMRMDLVIT